MRFRDLGWILAFALGGATARSSIDLRAPTADMRAGDDAARFGNIVVRASHLGRGESSTALFAAAPYAFAGTVHYLRGAVDEWYRSAPEGVEQGFTLADRPLGEGMVHLGLRVDGARVEATNDGVELVGPERRIRAFGLSVLDADGRKLAARFEPTSEGVRISFDDEGARYPIVVDPYYSSVTPITPSGKSTLDVGCAYSTAMRALGNRVFLGVPCGANSAVYVFRWDGTVLVEDQRLTPSDPSADSDFGSALAVAVDSSVLRLYVGAPKSKKVYAFSGGGTTFTEVKQITATGVGTDFGNAIAFGVNGTTKSDLGIYGIDAASKPALWMFERNGTTYKQINVVTFPAGAVPAPHLAISSHFAMVASTANDLYDLHEPTSVWTYDAKAALTVPLFASDVFGRTGLFGRQLVVADNTYGWGIAGTLTGTGSDASVSINSTAAVIGSSAASGDLVVSITGGAAWSTYATVSPGGGPALRVGLIDKDHVVSSDDANVRLVRISTTKPNGLACTTTYECMSGFCVDGVCCDVACTGTCTACTSAKKGAGVDGVCGNVVDGGVGRATCTSSGTTCGPDGKCDGKGACRTGAPKGVSCGTTVCAAGTLTGPSCDGAGTCAMTPATCAPFVCKDAATCFTSCTTDASCAAPNVCVSGICRAKLANGQPTPSATVCTSGFAADGVCCDAACAGPCDACTAAKKGSGTDGACGPIAAGTDPDEECKARCMGATAVAKGTCDGSHKCTEGGTVACAPYGCESGACKSLCFDDSDCISATCDKATGTCVPKATTDAGVDATTDASPADSGTVGSDAGGTSVEGTVKRCTQASECSSGFCVDGICCDSACTDTCKSCTLPSAPGRCSLVPSGLDPRHQCGAERSCHQTCSGSGTCVPTRAGDQCAPARCTDGSHGLGPATCPALDGVCPDATTPFDCANYACLPAFGACATQCVTSEDCAVGFACDTPSARCVASPPAEDAGGCAFGRTPSTPLLTLLGLALSLGAWRRRATRDRPGA